MIFRHLRIKALAVALGGATGLGCATTGRARVETPRDVLAAVTVAARSRDAAVLYALLPDAARQAEPIEGFRARMERDGAELGILADRTEGALGRENPVVDLSLADGEVVSEVDTREGWRLNQPGLGPPTALTPDGALRALHTALQRRSLGALLGVLSDRARGTLEVYLNELLVQTVDPSGLEHVATAGTGERSTAASIRLPDGRVILLRREDGAWRVDDIRDPP